MQVAFSPGAEIKFEGANNFRELGGYRASDGRQVKYGLLYRGGNLDLLKSEADHARLASLGLREILDLRSAGESAAHPDPAVPGAHYQRVCGMRNADGTEMDFSGQGIERLRQEKEAFERSVGRPVHDFEWFSALYREMPFRNPAYHALFALLEGRRVPVLSLLLRQGPHRYRGHADPAGAGRLPRGRAGRLYADQCLPPRNH